MHCVLCPGNGRTKAGLYWAECEMIWLIESELSASREPPADGVWNCGCLRNWSQGWLVWLFVKQKSDRFDAFPFRKLQYLGILDSAISGTKTIRRGHQIGVMFFTSRNVALFNEYCVLVGHLLMLSVWYLENGRLPGFLVGSAFAMHAFSRIFLTFYLIYTLLCKLVRMKRTWLGPDHCDCCLLLNDVCIWTCLSHINLTIYLLITWVERN